MNRPEQNIQIRVVQWLDIIERAGRLKFFAIENGGFRTKAEAGIGKAMGRKPGVSDLGIMWKIGHFGFIEMKAEPPRKRAPADQLIFEDKRLTGKQPDFAAAAVAFGFRIAIAHNLETVRDTLIDWTIIRKDEFRI
jgi:hypothetical protein